jgi:hypothetical protein
VSDMDEAQKVRNTVAAFVQGMEDAAADEVRRLHQLRRQGGVTEDERQTYRALMARGEARQAELIVISEYLRQRGGEDF